MSVLIHFDTLALPSTSSTDLPIIKNNGNPFDVTYNLKTPISNVREVTLRSAEIPIGFYNIRTPFNTLELEIQGSTSVFYIPPSKYNDINVFVAAANDARTLGDDGFGSELGVGLTFFVSGEKVGLVSSAGSGTLPLTIHTTNANGYPNILYLFGFTEGQTITTHGVPVLATNNYSLTFDTYINIYIPYLRSSSAEPSHITFKVPVTPVIPPYHTIYYTSDNTFRQTVYNSDMGQKFQTLQIQVYDRFGNLIDNNGKNWSMTLEINCY
jgi:hypothetical protein